MAIASFKQLVVWQKSFALCTDVYELTNRLPKEEQFGLTSQMRRSSVSIPSNIAEGQQRNNIKEYRQFIGIAKGSAAELETQLLLAEKIYSLPIEELMDELSQIQKMLYALYTKLN